MAAASQIFSTSSTGEEEIEEGAVAAEFAVEDPSQAIHTPSNPLRGYEILELRASACSPAALAERAA